VIGYKNARCGNFKIKKLIAKIQQHRVETDNSLKFMKEDRKGAVD